MSNGKDNFDIFLWDETSFYSAKDDWADLLGRSSADPLFMSWAWMSSWWLSFSDDAMELKIVVIKDKASNRLVALAPLYLTKVLIRQVLHVKRLQFIGNCWHGKPTMRTELLEAIVDNEFIDELLPVLWDFVDTKINWDEFVCQDMPKTSDSYKYLITAFGRSAKNRYLLRIVDHYHNYFLSLRGEFSIYLSKLGAGTRSRLYNRRKILAGVGDIRFFETKELDCDLAFDSLNSLHQLRWHKPVFNSDALLFNKMLARRLEDGRAVRFSYISCNDEVISIQYNYLINDSKYNIQAGFRPDFFKKVSLGYLHFGYEIEQCYQDSLKRYYFLAGDGKNINYKAQLTDDSFKIADIIIVKKNTLKILYGVYDKATQYFNGS